jgi:23S rRNA (uridine2552-2'-O)-methyltransferase
MVRLFRCSSGTFVARVFQSGADAALMTQLTHDFATVKHA